LKKRFISLVCQISCPDWHSGSIIHCMNKVTLAEAQLVLGWVTIFGWVYHPGQLSIAF